MELGIKKSSMGELVKNIDSIFCQTGERYGGKEKFLACVIKDREGNVWNIPIEKWVARFGKGFFELKIEVKKD